MVDLAVIGAGIMGTNHVRVARAVADARVRLVVDSDARRAQALAEPIGARWATELPDDLSALDAAVLAVPTELHVPLGKAVVDAGLHLLVEKPLARTIEEATELVDAARAKGVMLMVGHTEQFNTAALELDRLVDRVVHIDATRAGPYSPRVADGVILDLMIHDLDLIRRFAGPKAEVLGATATSTRSFTADLASAILAFETGVTATLTASRIGQQKIRRLEITQPDQFIQVDLLRQDVTITRVTHSEFLSDEGARYRQSGVVEIPFLEQRGEPLLLELTNFVDSIRNGEAPRVTGEDAIETLKLALQVERAAEAAAPQR